MTTARQTQLQKCLFIFQEREQRTQFESADLYNSKNRSGDRASPLPFRTLLLCIN